MSQSPPPSSKKTSPTASASASSSSSTPTSQAIAQPLILFAPVPKKEQLAAFVILLLVTIARFLPSFQNPFTEYLGGVEGDNGLYVWLFRYHTHHILHSSWFETNGFYPYTGSLAWSDSFLLPGILGSALVALGLSEPAAYNCIILGAYTFSGFFLWLCIARISGSTSAGLISAIGWLSWGYWGLHVGHPQLLFHVFLSAGLYLFFCILRNPRFVTGALATLLLIAAFATTAYYAIFVMLLWAVLIAGLALTKPHAVFSQRNIWPMAGAITLSPFLLPVVFPYLQTIALFGTRGLYEAHYFSAHARAWLSSPPMSLIYGSTAAWGAGEANLFPGILVIILAVFCSLRLARSLGLQITLGLIALEIGVVATISYLSLSAVFPYSWRLAVAASSWVLILTTIVLGIVLRALEARRGFSGITHRSVVYCLLLLSVTFWLLSFGPLGNPEKGQLALGPWAAVHQVVPGASAIRAVSRCAVVAMLGICSLAGLGIGLKLPSSPRLLIVAPLFILIIWFEGSMQIQPAQPLPETPDALQKFLSAPAVSSKASAPVMIGLPFTGELDSKGIPLSWGDFATRQTTFLSWLTPLNIPAINGYSGQQTKIMKELPRQLIGFPNEQSISALCSFAELRYVFLSSQIALPKDLPPALKRVTSDVNGNSVLELDCMQSPFLRREFILPPATRKIACEQVGQDEIALSQEAATGWEALPRSGNRVSWQKREEHSQYSPYLSRVALQSTHPTRIGNCSIEN